jgi:hypothetical protein
MSRVRVYLAYGSTIARLSRGAPKLTQLGSPSPGFSPGPPLGPQETDKAREMGFLSKRHSGLSIAKDRGNVRMCALDPFLTPFRVGSGAPDP